MQHKRKFRFIALILCFTLFISALTPVNAYAREAADFDFVTEYHVTTISSDEYSDHVQQPLPYKFNLNINQALVREVEIFIDDSDSDVIKVYKGDKVNFSLKTWNASRYDHWAQILVDATGTSKNFNDVSYDRSTGVYSGSYVSNSDGYLSQFIFDFQTPYYTSSVDPTSYKFRFDVTSFKVSIDRAQDVEQSNFFKNILNNLKDWFSSLFQWLKDIRDNITNGFSNIGTWFSDLGSKIKGFFTDLTASLKGFFSDLGNKISDFFTNLTNNLKTWFQNVGKWFSDLGDKISGFFSNLWNNISGTVTDIRVTISDWWQGVVEWFHNLFVPEDGFFENYKAKFDLWFQEHFGAVYQAIFIVDNFISMFNDYHSAPDDFIINIPAIHIPVVNATLYSGGSYYFKELFKGNSAFSTVMSMFRVMLGVLIYFGLVMLGKKTFEEIIADREI